MSENIWVIFDGYGEQVFFTMEEQYANLNDLDENEYNKAKCSIVLNVPNYTGEGLTACQKNMDTGEITIITRDRKWKPPHPHIPAP
jgi:hypothetical protein